MLLYMRQENGNTSIYIKDKNLYLKNISRIRELWYSLFMEHLSTSDIIQKSLMTLVSQLENEEELKRSDSSRKISDKYARIGE